MAVFSPAVIFHPCHFDSQTKAAPAGSLNLVLTSGLKDLVLSMGHILYVVGVHFVLQAAFGEDSHYVCLSEKQQQQQRRRQ